MKIRHLLISLVFTMVIFLVHMTSNVDSMFNNKNNSIDLAYLTQVIDYHENVQPTFVKRPIYTFVINKAANLFNLSTAISFVLLNLLFIFLNGILIFYLTCLVTKN